MIDFHSHILPGIDDGSRNVEESLLLRSSLREQGVTTVCATPHFYAAEQSPAEFLQKRQQAYETLSASLPASSPEIKLGAEVLYYSGISHSADLSQLCLQGTNLLLLEMPFVRWSTSVIREVADLARSGDFTVLLAHIERYYFRQPLSVWDRFLEEGIVMQANAGFFLSFRTKRKALRLLKENRIHVLGSDCHNMSSRPPRLAEARSVIQHSLDPGIISRVDSCGYYLINR